MCISVELPNLLLTIVSVLKESHERGHLKFSDPNLMPPDDKKEENTDQLNRKYYHSFALEAPDLYFIRSRRS